MCSRSQIKKHNYEAGLVETKRVIRKGRSLAWKKDPIGLGHRISEDPGKGLNRKRAYHLALIRSKKIV